MPIYISLDPWKPTRRNAVMVLNRMPTQFLTYMYGHGAPYSGVTTPDDTRW